MLLPIGYRGVKEQVSTAILEDAPLPDTSQRESDMELSAQYEESEMEGTPGVLSPAPIARVLAAEDDEDHLGLDDDEPAYYDSGDEE